MDAQIDLQRAVFPQLLTLQDNSCLLWSTYSMPGTDILDIWKLRHGKAW